MIVCRDCINYRAYENLEYGNCFHDLQDKTGAHDSCIFAERADGLTECCATCKDYEEATQKTIVEGNFWNCCKKEYWDINGSVNIDKIKCDEWQPREEKE